MKKLTQEELIEASKKYCELIGASLESWSLYPQKIREAALIMEALEMGKTKHEDIDEGFTGQGKRIDEVAGDLDEFCGW